MDVCSELQAVLRFAVVEEAMASSTPLPRRLITLEEVGPHGGPTYRYRGAIIAASKEGTVFGFRLKGFPNGGWTGMGSLDLAMRVLDSWLDSNASTLRPRSEAAK